MKALYFIAILLITFSAVAQEDFLAKQYFNDGDFEKAVIYYEKLVEKNPRRTDYTEGLIATYQQLERYTDAEEFLLKKIQEPHVYPTLFIELGYNYTLQNRPEKAKEYYEKAISQIDQNPNYGYGIGYRFQKYALLDEALKAYNKAMELNPQLDYNYQMARIYGEQGNIEKMYVSYLNLISEGKTSKSNVLRSIDDFITADPENENNLILKKTLLQNAQKNPNILWNELLSWLFVQQKQYGSAFRQEKAIYKRMEGANTQRLNTLGNITLEDNETDTAQEIFQYIADNSADAITKLNAQLNLIDIQLLDPSEKALEEIQKQFDELIALHGYKAQTLQLQVAYANFLTFKKENPEKAVQVLKQSLELPLNNRGKAFVKLALGDILVFDRRFNEALIYFSQIQKNLKNDVLGQNARYKVAQTSFYKGDFDWALTQLKVLRSSTSQLIANDAMQLSLLISDNSLEDSTQTSLKKYARADLLAYQNKTKEAITELDDILKNHKGEKIEDEALLKQGELLERTKAYEAAEYNYLKIIEFYANGILADDAHFKLAELYRNKLDQPEKAKTHYEKIIYNYQDSYYFPQARKNFRMLRGDAVN
ncbi:tetratricopeptide repeat protein [Zobellia galactanivorans]|uniref:tetratricopeptide repeat protein n=1 Tax=Zobellia galactanivorans (strain DSM 12802 / CCUG 47099 / CIP 106680 / NCIMB 13871 / Dsij) TaxID=63186 RepID=UPI0026E332A9|nr:tetratricopeptide repeat protein [Zobellia galactanivorans]MDO6810112.1 tetratricopeptide repeat protein [Zobellia galactanivorans]